MPISKKEWNDGVTLDTLEGKIRNFLSSNPKNAYSSTEIWIELGFEAKMDTPANFALSIATITGFQHILNDLVSKRGDVKVKIVTTAAGKQTYYTWYTN